MLVDAGLFSGEIEPRICCTATMKLRGESCRDVDGSSALEWPKSTLAVLVLVRGRCRGVLNIVATSD